MIYANSDMGRQREFVFRTLGGRRRGAGRPPKLERAGVSHLPRADFAAKFPLHVTMSMRDVVWNLRSQRSFSRLARAFWAGGDKFGFRLVHYSVQGDHIHLLVEAKGKRALARGMQGLSVRVARSLNRMMGRRGRVLGDRYYSRVLRTPVEVKNVICYLQRNAQRHYGLRGPDPFASQLPLYAPTTWLARRLC